MTEQDKKKTVVTGGAGYIGSHIARALLERGFDVHVIDNLASGKREWAPEGVTLHEADIRSYDTIAPIIAGAAYVFHCAALPRVQFSIDHPQEAHDANVNGTFNVLLAAQRGGVARVVYSASSSAYGDQDVISLREDMRAHPKSPYGLHKYIGELYTTLFAEVFELSTVSLRYFNVYGPGMDSDGAYALVIPKFFKQKLEGRPITITGDGKQTRDFTHIRDVVRANLLAAESGRVGKGEVINIGAGNNIPINRVAELIGGTVEYIPARLEPHDTLADNTKAKELLGWEPEVSLEEGIAELKRAFGIA